MVPLPSRMLMLGVGPYLWPRILGIGCYRDWLLQKFGDWLLQKLGDWLLQKFGDWLLQKFEDWLLQKFGDSAENTSVSHPYLI